MMQAKVYNISGEVANTINLPEVVWQKACSPALLHQAVVAYLANKRVVYKHGKTRARVQGGGRKPWRQKGTGRARAGSIRSPLWRGGGKIFGATQLHNYQQRLPLAMKRRALLGALHAKAKANEVIVVEKWPSDAKTKVMSQLLKKLPSAGRTTLLVLPSSDKGFYQATRNLPKISSSAVASLNTYDILQKRYLVFSKDALTALHNRFAA